MQPITRGSAQSFCRTCLQDLTPATGEFHIYQEKDLDTWLQSIPGKKLNSHQIQFFPNKLCSACHIKTRVYHEYKQRTYCAGEVIKQVAEEQKANEMIMTKLANVCRICLNNVQNSRAINVFENTAVLNWLNATSVAKLEKGANIPNFVCAKCCRKVHVNLEFQTLVAQSIEYLKGILDLTDDAEPLLFNCKQEEEEVEEITVPLPVRKPEPVTTNNTYPLEDVETVCVNQIKQESLEDYECKDECMDNDIFAQQFPDFKCEVEIDENFIKEEEIVFADENQETPMNINDSSDTDTGTTSSATDIHNIKHMKNVEKIEKNVKKTKTIKQKTRKFKQKKSRIMRDESDDDEDKEEQIKNTDKTQKEELITKTALEDSGIREKKRDFKYKCVQCARRFSVQWIYEGHMRIHQGDAKPFHCPYCSKKYGQQSQLYRHLYDVHDVPQKPRIPAAVSAQIEYKCEFCCKIFKRQDHYRDHVDSVHHLIRRFKCSYCDRSFSLGRTLRLHEMRHTGECPYVCETCGRRFRKTTDLNIHMEKHTFPPELLCPICHRGKKSAEELKEHIAEHEAKMRHQCPKCGMLFKRASHLMQHDKAVHMKLRPFKCRYCDKAFALHGTTLAHERIHTGERPQICGICGVTYKTKRGLQAHVKRHETDGDAKSPMTKAQRRERKKPVLQVPAELPPAIEKQETLQA